MSVQSLEAVGKTEEERKICSDKQNVEEKVRD